MSGPEGVQRTRLRLPADISGLLTIRAQWRGPGDPQMSVRGNTVLLATRTAGGPASLWLTLAGSDVAVQAWGPGAPEAMDRLPMLLGAHDDPSPFQPRERLLRDLLRRFAGLRMSRSEAVLETLVPTIIAQKVTGLEAGRSHRALLRRFGERAPGPLAAVGLRVPPAAAVLGQLPYHALHPLGVERRRAETIIAAARAAEQLERAAALPVAQARRRLESVRGVGPWSAAETARLALGDADAVSVGDYNLPHLVSWALTAEPRGSDERMLELLEPYRGQRARVVLLLEMSGLRPPRFGPRLAPRNLAAI